MLNRGSIFAGHLIEGLLGHSEVGAVYVAHHPRLRRLIALKIFDPDIFSGAEMRGRFERESQRIAQLDHPSIVTIFDRGISCQQPWISMRYVDGTNAGAVDSRRLETEAAVHIITEMAKALDFAHNRGVLHQNVKPSNILLRRSVSTERRVFLTDFGIARSVEASTPLERSSPFDVSPAFASPEQLSGSPLDYRSDQYSLACTLFRLLTGTVPRRCGSVTSTMEGPTRLETPRISGLRPDLPRAADPVVLRAMAHQPADRFDSCTEFASAAAEALLSQASRHHRGRRQLGSSTA